MANLPPEFRNFDLRKIREKARPYVFGVPLLATLAVVLVRKASAKDDIFGRLSDVTDPKQQSADIAKEMFESKF